MRTIRIIGILASLLSATASSRQLRHARADTFHAGAPVAPAVEHLTTSL